MQEFPIAENQTCKIEMDLNIDFLPLEKKSKETFSSQLNER